MPSVAAIIFPFRRLAIWLSVLVLMVATLAVGDHLAARRAVAAGQPGALAGGRDRSQREGEHRPLHATDQRRERRQLLRAVDRQPGGGAGDAERPRRLPAGGRQRPGRDHRTRSRRRRATKGILSRAVRAGKRYAAETAIPLAGERVDPSGRQVVLLFLSPLNDVDRTVSTVRRDVLIAVAIALPVTWMVGLLAAYALAARIRRLERATRRIAAGNLATPVVDEGRDEIHELARAFDDMRRRLERTDRSRREFIANASHELRTPLFALGGFLELLEDEEDPDARREFVSTMQGQVSRLTRLATDLLDLSRLDAGGVDVARDDVDLASVAAQAAADFAAAAEQRGSTVTMLPGAGRDRDRGRGARRPGGAGAGRQRAAAQPGGRRRHDRGGGRRRHRHAGGGGRRAADRPGRHGAAVRPVLPRPGRRRGLRASGSRSPRSWPAGWAGRSCSTSATAGRASRSGCRSRVRCSRRRLS